MFTAQFWSKRRDPGVLSTTFSFLIAQQIPVKEIPVIMFATSVAIRIED